MKLLHATTVPSTLNFLRSQPAHLAAHGIDVVLLSSPGPDLEGIAAAEGARAIAVPMERRIAVGADLRTLLRLIRVLRRERPDVVHAHTPKAGLLATLAARAAGVPLCIYQIHGLRFLTATGLRRRLLKATEKVACTAAHRVLCVSPSVLDLAEDEHLLRPGRGRVIGEGTINGVDVAAFDPAAMAGAAAAARAELGIPEDAPVIGFVGRLAADKGVAELEGAWARLRKDLPEARLVLVGDAEENDPVDRVVMRRLARDPRVHLAGFRGDVRPLMAAMSVLVLPSAREGFPQTVLEASALGVATVGSDVPGVRDAVRDGVTGLLYPLHDETALADRLRTLLRDPELRRELGANGRRRAVEQFDRAVVRERFLAYYLEAAAERGIAVPSRVESPSAAAGRG